MDKTIEKEFFEAFKRGGVVDNCIELMRYIYNLPPMRPSDSKGCEKPQDKKAEEKWDKFYKEILEKIESFNDDAIMDAGDLLMDEIGANLNGCSTEVEREIYLFSLLKPFGDIPSGCGIARIYHPKAEIKRLKSEIVELERDKAFWQEREEDEPVEDVNGKFAGISKEQIEACNDMIERRKEQMDWVLYVNRRFCELTGKVEDGARWMQKGTVEYCLSAFVRIMGKFANRLDALLLVYGIDLMRLQEVSGLYIKSYRQIADIYIYIGSWELAQRYINALPKQIESNKEVELANESQQELQKEIYKISLPSETNEKASKRGRQSRSFESCLIDDDISKLEALRNIMNGKKGKEAALVIKVAVKIGWITKPTYQAVVNEFGDIGHRSNYNKYINENKFTNDEIEGMKAKLIAE